MPWFSVRSVYLFDRKTDGTNVFEERIVCFEADNADEALLKAERESQQYCAASTVEVFPEWRGYAQDGDALIDGYEVWSALLDARVSLEDFYAQRYARYDHGPEPTSRSVD